MPNTNILGTTTSGDILIVTGTVGGVQMTGQGKVSYFNQLPNDQKKTDYLHNLLTNGVAPASSNQVPVQKYLHEALHTRVWAWVRSRFEHMMISVVVFVLGSIAQHIFFHYLPQIQRILHVNLSFLK